MPKDLRRSPIVVAATAATIVLTIAGVLRAGPGAGPRAGFAVAAMLLLATLAARRRLGHRREAFAVAVASLHGAGSVVLLLTLAALAPDGAALVALAMVAAALGLGARAEGPDAVEYGDGHPCM